MEASMSTDSFGELDDIGFLREAELFCNMPESVIRAIVVQARTASYPSGSMVVRRGDPGDSVFVVKSGVVEVVSPAEDRESSALAYLGKGECFGELALLTGSPRHADVRVPEQAELLIIEQELFQELMDQHPGFARQLSVILAHRQVKLLQNLPASDKKELQGSLRYFDLATVIQTLISSSQSGVMTLAIERQPVAQVSFQAGNIFRVSFQHRTGDEAVHHLFQAQPMADFRFASSKTNGAEEPPDPGITGPAMVLMMESVRLQDELGVLKEKMPPDGTSIRRSAPSLEWDDPDDKDEAEELWARLETPTTVEKLLDGSSRCHYHAGRALVGLLDSKQVEPDI
jgi:CRP-like cAMP-binding protein